MARVQATGWAALAASLALISLACPSAASPSSAMGVPPVPRAPRLALRPAHGGAPVLRCRGGDEGLAARLMDLSNAAKEQNFDIAAAARGDPPPNEGARVEGGGDGMQEMMELCQNAMDDCYDYCIAPAMTHLENLIQYGEPRLGDGEYIPLKNFSKECTIMIKDSKKYIDKAVDKLTVELETCQFRASGAVSSVDFERLPEDKATIKHLASETRRELSASFDRSLEHCWSAQKAAVAQTHFDRFDAEFDGHLAGTIKFDRWCKKHARKTLRDCEREMGRGIPPLRRGTWNVSQHMDEMRKLVNESLQARRAEGGCQDLLDWFAGRSEPEPFTRMWCKRMVIKGIVMYYQICQSAWVYRKARGLSYPDRFSKEWFSTLLMPWTVEAGKPLDTPPAPRANETAGGAVGGGEAPMGEAGALSMAAGEGGEAPPPADAVAEAPPPRDEGPLGKLREVGDKIKGALGGIRLPGKRESPPPPAASAEAVEEAHPPPLAVQEATEG